MGEICKNAERWSNLFKEQYVVVAMINQQLVGFATLKSNSYIDFFYVHHQFQRQGIAKLLYDRIEEMTLSNHADILISDVSITAVLFFKSQGYSISKKNHNKRGNEVLINYTMEKNLARA